MKNKLQIRSRRKLKMTKSNKIKINLKYKKKKNRLMRIKNGIRNGITKLNHCKLCSIPIDTNSKEINIKVENHIGRRLMQLNLLS